jgi:restriction system protein
MNTEVLIGAFLLVSLVVLFFIKSTPKKKKSNSNNEYEEISYLGGRIYENMNVRKLAKTYLQYTPEEFKSLLDSKVSESLKSLIGDHFKTLSRKRHRLLIKDDYGCIDEKNWHSEVQYFSEKIILPVLPELINDNVPMIENYIQRNSHQLSVKDKEILTTLDTPDVYTYINKYLDVEESKKGFTTTDRYEVDNMDPYEFESYCAELLRKSGFDAYATQGSGDQGVDVKADKNGEKWVFQCKLYSQPVGNKAVQEVIAGRGYEDANKAAVVTNNGYTKSAKELAQATGVLLLHYTELELLG